MIEFPGYQYPTTSGLSQPSKFTTKNQSIFGFKFMKKINWLKGLRIIFTSSAFFFPRQLQLLNGEKNPFGNGNY